MAFLLWLRSVCHCWRVSVCVCVKGGDKKEIISSAQSCYAHRGQGFVYCGS